MKAQSPQKQSTPLAQEVAQSPAQSVGNTSQDLLGNAAMVAQMKEPEVEAPAPDKSGLSAAELEKQRPVNGDVDSGTRQRLMDRLNGAPETVQVLADIKKLRGDLNFALKWSDRGSYHKSGSISLDRHAAEDAMFATMSHELVHLHTHLSGKQGSIKRDDRDTYVTKMMDDEIKAQTTAFVSLLQSGVTKQASSAGFDEFYKLLTSKHKDLLGPELRGSGGGLLAFFSQSESGPAKTDWDGVKNVAKEFLTSKFKGGGWVTSNTGDNYYDYYGGFWDQQHKK
ncbi:MAG: hypothetical protein JXX28_19020 [Deltaproteobacteria bacterium]|nr:hypothetical protein [Deltaproteobacteria bacterium]